ncbi:MAG: hypothetical protein J4O03_11605 [Chloroflexi bacterium]|nr:hypothetical protein [Chloroflexota bacterium]MCI0794100.1 hypothetical protein [Chloroflexota bacterium]
MAMVFGARVLMLSVALVLAGSALVTAGTVTAGDGDIEVLEMSAESRFPDGIRFTITVRSTDEIDDIRVIFRKVGGPRGSAYRVFEFEPGTLITADAFLKGAGNNYIPPGTKIEYSFEIRDKGGGVHRTPDQEFIYDDIRFEWQTVSDGLITVYYSEADGEDMAQTVLEAAQGALERMAPTLGIEPIEPLRIVTYSNYTNMESAIPFRSQAVRDQLRTEGIAFTDERVLLVHSRDASVKGTVAHEFIHLLVAEATGRANAVVPSWLNEGLAESGNEFAGEDYAAALRYGAETGQLNPLWYQRTFVGTPEQIIIAYGQGESVVNYLISEYGARSIARLLKTIRVTLDIDEALQEVYGFDQHGLDAQWREAIGLEPLPTPESPEAKSQPVPATENPPTPTAKPTKIPTAVFSPAPEDTPPPNTAGSGQDRKASGGCNAPIGGADQGAVTDPALPLLLGGLLAMLVYRRSRPGSP